MTVVVISIATEARASIVPSVNAMQHGTFVRCNPTKDSSSAFCNSSGGMGGYTHVDMAGVPWTLAARRWSIQG